jgi:hypothetical protein
MSFVLPLTYVLLYVCHVTLSLAPLALISPRDCSRHVTLSLAIFDSKNARPQGTKWRDDSLSNEVRQICYAPGVFLTSFLIFNRETIVGGRSLGLRGKKHLSPDKSYNQWQHSLSPVHHEQGQSLQSRNEVDSTSEWFNFKINRTLPIWWAHASNAPKGPNFIPCIESAP